MKKDLSKILLPAAILIGGAYLFLSNDTESKKEKILESQDLNFTQKAALKNFLFPRMDTKSVNILYNVVTDPQLTSAYRSGIVQEFIKTNLGW